MSLNSTYGLGARELDYSLLYLPSYAGHALSAPPSLSLPLSSSVEGATKDDPWQCAQRRERLYALLARESEREREREAVREAERETVTDRETERDTETERESDALCALCVRELCALLDEEVHRERESLSRHRVAYEELLLAPQRERDRERDSVSVRVCESVCEGVCERESEFITPEEVALRRMDEELAAMRAELDSLREREERENEALRREIQALSACESECETTLCGSGERATVSVWQCESERERVSEETQRALRLLTLTERELCTLTRLLSSPLSLSPLFDTLRVCVREDSHSTQIPPVSRTPRTPHSSRTPHTPRTPSAHIAHTAHTTQRDSSTSSVVCVVSGRRLSLSPCAALNLNWAEIDAAWNALSLTLCALRQLLHAYKQTHTGTHQRRATQQSVMMTSDVSPLCALTTHTHTDVFALRKRDLCTGHTERGRGQSTTISLRVLPLGDRALFAHKRRLVRVTEKVCDTDSSPPQENETTASSLLQSLMSFSLTPMSSHTQSLAQSFAQTLTETLSRNTTQNAHTTSVATVEEEEMEDEEEEIDEILSLQGGVAGGSAMYARAVSAFAAMLCVTRLECESTRWRERHSDVDMQTLPESVVLSLLCEWFPSRVLREVALALMLGLSVGFESETDNGFVSGAQREEFCFIAQEEQEQNTLWDLCLSLTRRVSERGVLLREEDVTSELLVEMVELLREMTTSMG